MWQKRLGVTSVSIAVALALTACGTSAQQAQPAGGASQGSEVTADGIGSIEEGITWARQVPDSVTADELSTGIARIADYLPDLDIEAEASSEIGSDLLELHEEILSDPDDGDEHVDDLNDIVDDIERAIDAPAE